MNGLMQDLRQATRQLRRAPGFLALAVLTLGVAIGANTAMFTVAEDVLLRPLPYADASRLLAVSPDPASLQASLSWMNIQDIRAQATHTLSDVGMYTGDLGVVQGSAADPIAPLSVATPNLTPNVFAMLGVRPLLGRVFTAAEGEAGGPQVVLLSEALWRESFHADPGILGRSIRVNNRARTVVGVMPGSFRFPEMMRNSVLHGVWLPLQPTAEMRKDRGFDFGFAIAKLRPGATLAQARAELDRTARTIRAAAPADVDRSFGLYAGSYLELVAGSARPVFLALSAALGMVLLIACANVANLLLARCLGRQQEYAVRAALGASGARLVRSTMVEGALLSALGCGMGIALAAGILAALRRLPPGTLPRAESIRLDWTALLALGLVATLTTVLSSLLPALRAARTSPQRALQSGSRGLGSRSVSGTLAALLVVGEVALSTLLLIATGLMVHTLWNLSHTDLGFETTRVTEFTAMPADATGFSNMGVSGDPAHAPLSVAVSAYRPVLDRLRAAPGVADVALATAPPFSGVNLHTSLEIVGEPKDPSHQFNASITAISPGYARVLGTPLLRGRMISEGDTASAPFVAVINEAARRAFFGSREALGRQLDLGADAGMLRPYTIVGVLADQHSRSIAQADGPALYLPYQQVPTTSLFYPALLKTIVSFLVRTRGDVAVAPLARAVFHDVAPDYALDNFETLSAAVDRAGFGNRLGLGLTAAFATVAALMVVTGLYGVLAQLVGYRRREIGIRLALGAPRSSVLQMVLRRGAWMMGGGLLAGLVLSALGGRLVSGFLYGVRPGDPWTYAGVLLALAAVGTAASYVPAWRAAQIPPVEALRDE